MSTPASTAITSCAPPLVTSTTASRSGGSGGPSTLSTRYWASSVVRVKAAMPSPQAHAAPAGPSTSAAATSTTRNTKTNGESGPPLR